MSRHLFSFILLAGVISCGIARSQEDGQKLPKEDVVVVPAIGKSLCVSNAFQTNMVIQRDKPVPLWGWADPGEKVTVAFAGQTAEATADSDRAWKVSLAAMPANGTPQVMTIKGKSATLELTNILVGDVWILGGQSNMEFSLDKVNDGPMEIASANFPQIRLLAMPKGKGFEAVGSFERLHEWSDWSKRHFSKGNWNVCTPKTVSEFSAIGYIFGRRLFMASQVPIGLINTSLGGTTVETWTPEPVLKTIEGAETQTKLKDWNDKIAAFDPQADLQKRIAGYEQRKQKLAAQGRAIPADSAPPTDLQPGPAGDMNRPGFCYAGVIRPLEGLAVAGAVFHQGFNNCFEGSAGAKMYYQIFGRMITAWRSAFQEPKMPFCIISLCTAGEPQTPENFLKPMNDAGAFIREAQYKTFRDFAETGDMNIGFISSFDMRKSWYHPQIKIPVGERAAKWALASHYKSLPGRDAVNYWLPPSIGKMELADGKIRLTMSTTVTTKDDSDGRMLGFAIAGNDRRFYPAEIGYYSDGTLDERKRPKYQQDVLVLSSPFVPEPTAYRYAWARNPMANITNNLQVPLAAQRSDDWLLEESAGKIPLPENLPEDAAKRYVSSQNAKALELGDTGRRIQEAEATIGKLKPAYEKAKARMEEAAKKAGR